MNIANLLFQCGIVITTLGYRIRIFFILTPATTSLALALGRKKCTNTGFQVDGVQQQRGAPLGPPGMQGVGPGRGGGSAPEGGGGLLADSGELDYQPVSAWR